MGHGRLGIGRCNFLRVDGGRRADWITAAHARFDHTGVVDPVAVINGTLPASGIDGVADIPGTVIKNCRLAGMGKTQRAQQQQDSVESFHNNDPIIVIDYLNREPNRLWGRTNYVTVMILESYSGSP